MNKSVRVILINQAQIEYKKLNEIVERAIEYINSKVYKYDILTNKINL